MFKHKTHTETPRVETVIDLLLYKMETHTDPSSAEYAKMVDQYVKLQGAKVHTAHKPLDRNALLAIAGNLIGIGIIVGHERAHVVTSKALGFIGKVTT